LAIAVAVVMLLSMSAYALLSGADFGGGIWDLLAGGPERGKEPRETIDASVTPVWEANHVWLIFGLVLAWTAFPAAFAAAMITLFVPLSLSVLGIVAGWVGFAFRHQVHGLQTKSIFGAMFAASSLLAPFFLGTAIGAIATGQVRAAARFSVVNAWTTPTALLTGGLFVAACAYVSAIYLIGDSRRRGKAAMVRYFRARAAAAGLATGALAAATLASMSTTGHYVFHRLLGTAVPLVALAVAAGLAALIMIAAGVVRGLRVAAALTVASVVFGWGWAQYPWLLPRTLNLQAGAAPTGSLVTELAIMGLIALLAGPAFVLLFWLQQRDLLGETDTIGDLRRAMEAAESQPPTPVIGSKR
jgi:cytochrome d ubiquinol oxidase subunit II